jgi:hypothetical protein
MIIENYEQWLYLLDILSVEFPHAIFGEDESKLLLPKI